MCRVEPHNTDLVSNHTTRRGCRGCRAICTCVRLLILHSADRSESDYRANSGRVAHTELQTDSRSRGRHRAGGGTNIKLLWTRQCATRASDQSEWGHVSLRQRQRGNGWNPCSVCIRQESAGESCKLSPVKLDHRRCATPCRCRHVARERQ